MLDSGKQSRSNNSKVVSRRFWTLLGLVLFLAVSSSALAIRFTANSFLADYQAKIIVDQAEIDARNLESILARHRLLLSIIGNTTDVVNVIMGYVDNTDVVSDKLEKMHRPDSLSWVTLFDALGEEMVHFNAQPAEQNIFAASEIAGLVDKLIDQTNPDSKQVLLRTIGKKIYIVLAEPILNAGWIEGYIVATFSLDMSVVFPANEVAQSTYVTRVGAAESVFRKVSDSAERVELATGDLAIILEPDFASVEGAGAQLLRKTVGAIAGVLTLAFALFAALGRAALVEPHRKLEAQKKSLAELAAAAELANDAIIMADIQGRVVWGNPAFQSLSGYNLDEIIGRTPGSILTGEKTDLETVSAIENAYKTGSPIKTEILNYSKKGDEYWIAVSISPLQNEEGELYGFVSISHEVTEARRQREEILAAKKETERQALHDPLTGLPNRRALDLALKEKGRAGENDAALVRIDLDHFKYVNDTLGHEAGDFVLCEVAKILRDETKGDDLPVRVGGDEFVILLGESTCAQAGESLAQRMLERIRIPKIYGNKTVRGGASFGVASTCEGLLPLEDLTIGADAALYEAKDLGRNKVRIYTPELHKSVLDRRKLARAIRRGIANEEFVPHFQPQFDAHTFEIVGVETLMRWAAPDLGLLYPDTFLPVARQLSCLDDIDAVVFQKALREIELLNAEGTLIPKVSFNITAERIQNPDFLDNLPKMQENSPRISFEILESVLVEEQSDLFNFSLDRLRDIGFTIEIDDFGSGHASIVGLMHLCPDVMKIDQRLIMPIVECETTRNLLKQIVGMAELMGLRVTAEGVETFQHAEILAEMGCHTLQGYAFAKAMPAHELKDFVMSHGAESLKKAANDH
ncbi:MAG: EAL domain-containing protein [Paracoccaceae bacterium]